METNNAKHTNLLGFEAKEPMNYNGYPSRTRKQNEIQVVHMN